MGLEKARSPVGLGKIAIVLLGIASMGIVLHSHFESSWKTHQFGFGAVSGSNFKFYKICGFFENNQDRYKTCPGISMEQFLVSVVIIFFILSFANLALFLFSETLSSGTLKFVDIGYHVLSAVLLLAAGVVYIISAEQIPRVVDNINWRGSPPPNFLRGEKLLAGCLAAAQSLLYGAVAILIFRRRESK